MAATTIGATNGECKVIELTPRRAQRNLKALREAQMRHPSYIGRQAAGAESQPCPVLPFAR